MKWGRIAGDYMEVYGQWDWSVLQRFLVLIQKHCMKFTDEERKRIFREQGGMGCDLHGLVRVR